MPKVGKASKLNRVARRVAASAPFPVAAAVATKEQSPSGASKDEPNVTDSQTMSRGQRKRLAKRDQYIKKEKMILSTLMLKKKDEQKQRIDGLDAIREAIMNTTKTPENQGHQQEEDHQPNYGSSKAKKNLITSEVERMSLVLQHPAFKEDPFATMQEHIRNTLANQKEKLERQAKEREDQDQAKQEEKKRLKKERLQGVKKPRKKFKPRRT